ncbi:MAG: HlyD family efflux transporter periplasmic adaptor subunit [Planctomycetaceae bacterium]
MKAIGAHPDVTAERPNGRTARAGSASIEELLAGLSVQPVTATSSAGSPRTQVEPTVAGSQPVSDEVPSRPVSDAFSRHFSEAINGGQDLNQVRRAVAAILTKHCRAAFVCWYVPAGDKIGQDCRIESLTTSGGDLPVGVQQLFSEQAREAVQCHDVRVGRTADGRLSACTVPVRQLAGQCLMLAVPTTDAPSDWVARTELAAAMISEWQADQERQQAVRDARHVAALVEIITDLSACRTDRRAAELLTDRLQRYLNASRSAIGYSSEVTGRCHLSALSGGDDISPFSELTRCTEAVLQESLARGTAGTWPAPDSSTRHALLAHQQLAEHERCECVVSSPLRNDAGHVVGAVCLTFTDPEQAEAAMRFLHAGERILATALQAIRLNRQTLPSRVSLRVLKSLRSAPVRWSLVAALLAGLALCVPMDYRVTCYTELQPVARRFVAAPFDAALETCMVEPGDVVEEGQLLATLDGRELRWELAGVRADLAKATKEHNTYLSEQKSGEAAIARHEIERLQNRSELLNQRIRNLEIRSPVAGVIVSGDLKDAEGIPLETGQSLFEVAPLDRMVVEVAIPEDDMRHVSAGMPLTLRLDAMPSESIEASLQKIHPKAELRDSENVFIAEAELSNHDSLLRPGMRGTAKVSTGPRRLGWNLFHKPVAHLTGWLGW